MSDDKKTELTLRDFKQWLAGVEEMQDDDWVPSLAQWTKIREKIECIKEVEVPVSPPAAPQPRVPVQPQQSELTPPPRPVTPPPPRPAPGSINPVMVGAEENTTAKTPHIDNSQGGYSSSFK